MCCRPVKPSPIAKSRLLRAATPAELGTFWSATIRSAPTIGSCAIGVLVKDITQRKETERNLKDSNRRVIELLSSAQSARSEAELANRMKDEFLARVSHELRTPLAAMVMWIHVLRLDKVETRKAALEAIDSCVRDQSKLIEDLLDVARGMGGKLRINQEPLDPHNVVKAAATSLRAQARSKSIRLTMRPSNEPCRVMADPDRLKQIVSNLLSNAIKFTPEHGRVEMAVVRCASEVQIVVRDTGDGISPEFLPQLFTAFRQADASLTRSQGGLGLGLAIVRELVELHRGNVIVESEGPNRGSTFTVSLPLAEQLQHRRPMESEPPPAVRGGPRDARFLGGTRRRRARGTDPRPRTTRRQGDPASFAARRALAIERSTP